MSITTTTKTRSIRARIALVPALSLSLLGGSAAMAAPAQADNDHDHGSIRGCTVKPLKPTDERGVWVNFKISVNCENGKRTVHIKQVRYEADRGSDTFLGHDYIKRDVRGYKTIDSLDKVRPNLDRKGSEEVYHVIWFAVEDDHGKLEWSGPKKSETLRHVNAHYDR